MRRAAALLAALAAALALARSARPPLREGVPVSRAVYDRKGRLLRLTTASDGAYRLWRPLAEMAPELAEATLLHEDRRFRLHPGVDPAAPADHR
jgi:penicillin-binding protein 1C